MPTPTPIPSEIFLQAERAYKTGDWERAELLYSQLLPLSSISQDQAIQASLGLGQTLLAAEKLDTAITVLTDLTNTEVQSGYTATAHLYLADALMASGNPSAAVEHYEAVLQAYPILAPYANEWIGNAAYDAGDYERALDAYNASLVDAESASQIVFMQEKIALVQSRLGNYEATIAAYDAILAIARIASYRARIMYQAANTTLIFGETDEAYRRMQELIATYPTQSHAYEALVKLVEAGQPVNELQRGIIDYHASAYTPAVQALYRAIDADPQHGGEPHYYIGLSFLEAGSHDLAIQEFDTLIETHPESDYWGSARVGKAAAQAALGQTDAAIQTYQMFAEQLPDHPRAPEALWEAAVLHQDIGDFAQAANAFLDLAERYPNDEGAPESRFRAGLLRYRNADNAGAREAWQSLISWYPYSDRAQAAYFWQGKTYLQSSQTLSATQALSQATAIDAWGYYGLRAADYRNNHAPFEWTQDAIKTCGTVEEQQQAENWLAGWLGLESAAGLGTIPADLLENPYLRRGTLLLRLDHFDEGRSELETLRQATIDDALTQYRLALTFRDIGLYRSSIIAASTVWRLSPATTLSELPRSIGCLIYPTYYNELVEQQAAHLNLDPLFVYALLRQESLFEGYATSYAAAQGLMQVIPSTGAQIADTLNWPPNYDTPDLYRPMVSVRFGTWYLAQQRDRIDGNLFAAMAGYNGGPGNAERWWNLANKDQDLFAEVISFHETRRYVRLIYEHYAKYKWLYRDAK